VTAINGRKRIRDFAEEQKFPYNPVKNPVKTRKYKLDRD